MCVLAVSGRGARGRGAGDRKGEGKGNGKGKGEGRKGNGVNLIWFPTSGREKNCFRFVQYIIFS